jgi:hypothetical protein
MLDWLGGRGLFSPDRLGSDPNTSLTDAITITCSVQRDVDVQMISVRGIGAWTKDGREPSAGRGPDRVNDVSHRFISVWLYGNEFAA